MSFAVTMRRLLAQETHHSKRCPQCQIVREPHWFRRNVAACTHCLDLQRRRKRLAYRQHIAQRMRTHT